MATPSYYVKLDRALDKLGELEARIQRWIETDACLCVTHSDVKTHNTVTTIRVFQQPDDPLIPLVVGECAHTLRQALDHFAYRLACKVHGADPPPNETNTEFRSGSLSAPSRAASRSR